LGPGVAADALRRGLALGVHEPPQSLAHVPIGVVDAHQMTIDGGRLNVPAALLQLGTEGI
jgi:hypothetical protein